MRTDPADGSVTGLRAEQSRTPPPANPTAAAGTRMSGPLQWWLPLGRTPVSVAN
jgi:hypothetical protein